MTINVDRATWLTGKVAEVADVDSKLYDPTTKMMCCLGFAARQCGISQVRIAAVIDPFHVEGRLPATFRDVFIEAEGDGNSDLAADAMTLNDNAFLTNARREAKLTALFRKHGHRIVFRGAYPTRQEMRALGGGVK